MAPLTQSISERFSQSIDPVNSAVHSMASSAQSACCCQESVTAKLCAFARAFYAQSPAGSRPIFRDEKAYALMGRDEYENMGRLIQCGYRPECLKGSEGCEDGYEEDVFPVQSLRADSLRCLDRPWRLRRR